MKSTLKGVDFFCPYKPDGSDPGAECCLGYLDSPDNIESGRPV